MNKIVSPAMKVPRVTETSVGLALSGGGARGAYQLGCWKAFLEKRIRFSAVAGSSIGALNGALIVQGDWDRAYNLWLKLTELSTPDINYDHFGKLLLSLAADIGLVFLPVPNIKIWRTVKYMSAAVKMASNQSTLARLRNFGFFRLEGVLPVLQEHIEIERVMRHRTPLYVTVCAQPYYTQIIGTGCWFPIHEQSEEEAWRLVTASMAIPLFFSPIHVNGQRYVDGGLGVWLPVKPLQENGFKQIIAIGTKAHVGSKYTSHPDCNVVVINPSRSLGRFPFATFKFTKETVLGWMEEGYNDTWKAFRDGRIVTA